MPSVCLDPEILVSAYAQGLFPMAGRDGKIQFFTADPRGILPLDTFHIPKTLGQLMRRKPPAFEIRINADFESTMRACAKCRTEGTWISDELVAAYLQLHELGLAHSVEAWTEGELVGGLYGVSLGGAFFGESMFHRRRDASKVALVHLVERLRQRGFELLDAQATTPHLARFGAVNVPAPKYLQLLQRALTRNCRFDD